MGHCRMEQERPEHDSSGSAALWFHEALRHFLAPVNRESRSVSGCVSGVVHVNARRRASVKDAIEALGPPHTEVGSILVNGLEKGFDHLIQPGERVAVHPTETPRVVLHPTLLRPVPLPCLAFAVDANVGKLARRLRLLGQDTFHDPGLEDRDLALLSTRRVVLTKDRGLLKRASVVHGYLVRNEAPDAQLLEVVRTFGLKTPFAAFSRCLHCNERLRPVAKEDVLHLLEPLTRKYFHEFHICPSCGKVFWAGSHHERLHARLRGLGLG
jgi:uncharacterized protein